jgi:teichoic acid transport system ATP-binding protein
VADPTVTSPSAEERAARLGEPTIVLEDLHVTYRVYEDRKPSLRQLIASRFKSREYREILAVRGVTLTARAGEAIGLIGPNGSGKSTLLRAVAGLMPPTKGQVYARSQPTLLGVGAALQPALSGRRNIELGGLALGMTRAELAECIDDIIDFSGLRKSIDLPLKTYSSGMRARLHFAVATAVKPDILLIDEALAVGDRDFRKRSEQRIRELQEHAGTIFLVSHSMKSIRDVCNRVIWLQDGAIVQDGDPRSVVRAYEPDDS